MSTVQRQVTREVIESALIKAVLEQQELSGEVFMPVKKETRPFAELPHFDSLRAISAMLEINAALGTTFEQKGEPFSGLTKSKNPSIEEIRDAILTEINKEV